MLVSDLIVEVRGTNFERIGTLVPDDLNGLTLVLRYNNVGTWSITLPSNHRLVDSLREPGAGIVVSLDSGTIFSGFTTTAKLEQSVDNPLGDWVVEGVSDSVILSERLAYPTPGESDVTMQIEAHDVRAGAAETVMKEYVAFNIGQDAGTDRAIPNLVIQEDAELGALVSGRARFDVLQELLYGLAQTGGLGYTIRQQGPDLVFEVYEPSDLSDTIRMDLENGRLTKTEYSYGQPIATRAIVGGAGEAEERQFYEGTTGESISAETLWNRRIEKFIDARGSEELADLEQSAFESLVDEGKTVVNLSVSPSDDQTMRFGYDWNLGDIVTVVAGEVETTAVVTEVGISVKSDGVRIGTTVGTPVPVDFESKLIRAQSSNTSRISNLERNATGFGVTTPYQPQGGTNGTQPTFSGPAISGSYTRFGNMVYFQIDVDFDNITSFGTGQYYLTLPYPSAHNLQLRDGCLHDNSAGTQYGMAGHVFAGSNVLQLNSMDKVSSGVQDVPFTSTFPVALATADNFHIAGTYEIEG